MANSSLRSLIPRIVQSWETRSAGRMETRAHGRVAALAVAVAVACEARNVDDSSGDATVDTVTGTSSGTSEGSEASDGSEAESSAGQPDPAAMQEACDASCTKLIECQPEVIPEYYESLEDCVSQCVQGLELNYADGCGPIMFMRIVCRTALSCEEWLDFVETGYSSCGDDPGDQVCGD